jgi:hypothetical protein
VRAPRILMKSMRYLFENTRVEHRDRCATTPYNTG